MTSFNTYLQALVFTQLVHWTTQCEFCWLIKPRFILTYGSPPQAEGDHWWTLFILRTGRRRSLESFTLPEIRAAADGAVIMLGSLSLLRRWTHNYNCWQSNSLIGNNRNKVSAFCSFTSLPAKRHSVAGSALSPTSSTSQGHVWAWNISSLVNFFLSFISGRRTCVKCFLKV